MSITFADLLDKLKQETEVDIIEILNLNADRLVDLLESEIHDNQERVRNYYDEDEDDEEEEI
jgi:hypothetical protein